MVRNVMAKSIKILSIYTTTLDYELNHIKQSKIKTSWGAGISNNLTETSSHICCLAPEKRFLLILSILEIR